MTDGRDHPLFRAFPLDGMIKTSTGSLPKPYQVYDGHALLIAGTADAAEIADRTKNEDVHPGFTSSGRVLMGLFVCDFREASLGPHLELQLSVLVRDRPGPVLSDAAAAYMAALGADKEVGSLCLNLFNDDKAVLAYNTEYLGLDAKPCAGEIRLNKNRLMFDFQDKTGAPLVSGDVRLARAPGIRIMLELVRCMGLGAFWRAVRQSWASADVINRKGPVVATNRRAPTRTKADRMILQDIDANDHIALAHPELAAYDFAPLCLQHLSPFRFVYLHPDAA